MSSGSTLAVLNEVKSVLSKEGFDLKCVRSHPGAAGGSNRAAPRVCRTSRAPGLRHLWHPGGAEDAVPHLSVPEP
jgi:hypothetical protein